MSSKLQVSLRFSETTAPILIGECLWIPSEKRVAFEWNHSFLNSEYELSPITLPKKALASKAPFEPFDGLHGLFSDSIPDGFGLRLMNQGLVRYGLSPSEVNPLHRLAWVGQHGIGALCYSPVIDNHDYRELAQLSEISHYAKLAQTEILEDIPRSMIQSGGSALGARPKFWAQVSSDGKQMILGDRGATPQGFSPILLKFAPRQGDQNEPFYEAACLSLVSKYGVPAARTQLITQSDCVALAVHRFDRLPTGRRIHMQSVAALLQINFRVPSLDYLDLVKLSAKLSGVAQTELIFRLACMNVALCNRDDHAKNFAFCMDPSGVWQLSPAFDISPNQGPNGWHTMTVAGEGQRITKEHLLHFAKEIQLSEVIAKDAIDKALTASNEFEACAINLGASKSGAKKWSTQLKKIAKDLL